jgi:hypothetical protein
MKFCFIPLFLFFIAILAAAAELEEVASFPNEQVTGGVEDKRLSWPDTMSWGPGQTIYVTASQIQNMPRFNGGRSARSEPYKVWKIGPVPSPP